MGMEDDARKHKKHKKSKSKRKRHKKEKQEKHNRSKKEKNKKKEKEMELKAKNIILAWCHKRLKPLFKEKKITRDEYTCITKKSVAKVMKAHDVWTKEHVKKLQNKSKDKVMDVVKGYIKKYRRK